MINYVVHVCFDVLTNQIEFLVDIKYIALYGKKKINFDKTYEKIKIDL